MTDRPRIPSLMRAVLAALFLHLAATVYAVASAIL